MWEQAQCSWRHLQSVRNRLPLAAGSALIISLNQGPVLSQVVGLQPYWPRGKHLLKQIHSCLCRRNLSGICFNFFLNLEEFKSAKQREERDSLPPPRPALEHRRGWAWAHWVCPSVAAPCVTSHCISRCPLSQSRLKIQGLKRLKKHFFFCPFFQNSCGLWKIANIQQIQKDLKMNSSQQWQHFSCSPCPSFHQSIVSRICK